MSVRMTIGDTRFEVESYRITEQVVSLTAGDSSGSVGTFDVTVKAPDVDAPMREGNKLLAKYGPDFFVGEPIWLADRRWGIIAGRIRDTSRSDQDGSITFTCLSRLESLNTYNVKAKPYRGDLEGAISYYLSLAGVTFQVEIDPFLAPRPVAYIGWTGELWTHLKMLCQAQDCEIALVNNTIVFRPTRRRDLVKARNVARSQSRQLSTLAQAVEVYNYNTEGTNSTLVYPVDGWDGSLEVLNVNAGEVAEYQLELNTSVTSITNPTMVENVGPDYKSTSVYTIVANDGLPIPPAQWRDHGGKVMFSINDDTVSLTATLWGAVGIYTASGELATNFSLALASDTTSNRYSTLRIRGTGVKFDKKAVRISTGVDPSRTNTDVGVTIDNPFLTDLDRVYRVGTAAATQYSGSVASVTGDVVVFGGSGETAVGQVAGSRLYDRGSHRWYRITSANIAPDKINFSADDDMTFDDLKHRWDGKTFGDVNREAEGLTFRQADAAGWDLA